MGVRRNRRCLRFRGDSRKPRQSGHGRRNDAHLQPQRLRVSLSKSGQFEFLPPDDSDLSKWKDMVTINLHEAATSGEKLAEVANKVLANYQRAGKILRTDSKPRTASRPAEYLIVAALGNADFLEAAFARLMLVDGAGVAVVYSHRIYGKAAGPAMSDWLKANGQQVEGALMAWDRVPTAAALKKLPPRN